MGIRFANNWSSGKKHINKEATARTVINNAVAALNTLIARPTATADEVNLRNELIALRDAVNSNAPNVNGDFLEVFKGEHQGVGLFDEELHLTMSLNTKNGNNEAYHALYGTALHLYVEAQDPPPSKNRYTIVPVVITYTSSQGQERDVQLTGAAGIDSDYIPSKK